MENKLKKKSGISTVFFAMFAVFFIAFLSIVLDIGKGYLYKQQMQSIADSVAVAGANYGGQLVSGGIDSNRKYIISESKAKSKVNTLVKENLKGSIIKDYKIYYNFEDTLSASKEKILWDAAVLRVEIVAEVPRFIGGDTLTVRSSSITRLTKASGGGSDVVDHDVRITNTHIKIYNSKGQLILQEGLS